MRVLLIDDCECMRRRVGSALRRAGCAVDVAVDGPEGLRSAQTNDYDVIVLDLLLPRMDGLSVLARLRGGGKDAHVLVLSALQSVEDRVRGLQLGADGYMVKPFAFDKFLARVQALARRSRGRGRARIRVGELEIDLARRTVSRRGTPIPLGAREFALLEYLGRCQGRVATPSEIKAHIYGGRTEPLCNVVPSAIYALRRSIDLPGRPSLIQTRRGRGYVLQSAET